MQIGLPKVILFDWDNTLVDTSPLILKAWNHVFSTLGLPGWSEIEVREKGQFSGRESFPRLFGDLWQEAQTHFYHYYDTYAWKDIHSLEGADSLLETIHNLAIPCGIVSNKRGMALRTEIQHMGWKHYFGAQIGAGDAVKDKPAPDPILLALEQMGYSPGPDVWFVGDAPVDWLSAQAAGCWPVPLGFWHEDARNFSQAVANCHDLEKILLRI